MKLSELIEQLEAIKDKHGDIEVRVQTLTHQWTPDPEVRQHAPQATPYVLLNP